MSLKPLCSASTCSNRAALRSKVSKHCLPVAKPHDSSKRARPASSKSESFWLFDLPGELRNRIYLFAIARRMSNRHMFFTYSIPAICRASQQLRKESLPIFFDVNIFAIRIDATYGHPISPDMTYTVHYTVYPPHVYLLRFHKANGTLKFFRHLRFLVEDTCPRDACRLIADFDVTTFPYKVKTSGGWEQHYFRSGWACWIGLVRPGTMDNKKIYPVPADILEDMDIWKDAVLVDGDDWVLQTVEHVAKNATELLPTDENDWVAYLGNTEGHGIAKWWR